MMLAALLLPALSAAPAQATPAPQTPDEQDLLGPNGAVVGRHYRQTGGGTGLGYDVREPFFSVFQALGGPFVVGYPTSIPFLGVDGCLYQDFQVALLQQCGGLPVALANTFQILQEAGKDERLQQLGIGPGENDNSTSFADAVRIRLGWLTDGAIGDRYLQQCGNGSADAAVQFCGLPMNHPASFGPFVSQRFQRIAFQRWLVDGPAGIRAGDVTAVLGGDLLKDTGVLSGPVVQPHAAGNVPALATVAFGGSNVPAAPLPRLTYGFQGDFFTTAKRPQAINLIKDAGFSWAKQQVVWSDYEVDPLSCPATSATCLVMTINGRSHAFRRDQLGFLDAVINDLSGAGLNVLASVVNAPAFLAAPGGNAPLDPQRLGDFVQFLATRYTGKIKAIEPWNEQNLAFEWGGSRLWPNAPFSPPQGAIDFVALQKAAYQGIKAADPAITVVLPAPTPTGVGECWTINREQTTDPGCLNLLKIALDDRVYLDFVFQVNGGEIKNYYDVMGVHPSGYNNAPDDWVDRNTAGTAGFKGHPSFYIRRYQQLHDIQVRYGDTKPMWFTEVGWSSTVQAVPGYEYGQQNTEEARGRYFARLLEQVKNEAPYVTNVIVWNLNFRTLVGPLDEKYGFGVVDAAGNPLPAYTCLRDFVRSGERITLPQCRTA